MRRKFLTPTGEQDIRQIYAYILTDNHDAAARFYESALQTFFEFPDDIQTPARAAAHLPEYVHVMHVRGFRGYTLRVAVFAEELYLLSAFAPGLPDEFKDARTLLGLREL